MIYIAAHVRNEDVVNLHDYEFIRILKKYDGAELLYPKDLGIYCSTLLFEGRYERDHFIMECEKNLGFRPEHESMRYDTKRGWIE